MRWELNVTYRCNAQCKDCNRAVGLIDLPESDMSVEQVSRMVAAFGHRGPVRVTLAGGEPLLHPQLQDIIDIISQLSRVRRGFRVLTNHIDEVAETRIRLPDGWRWKRDHPRKKRHYPQWWSPRDYGYTEMKRCNVQWSCGIGTDAWGFLPCGIAGILGRLLKVNPYSKRVQREMIPEICQHCQHSLPRMTQRRIHRKIRQGKLTYPTETWRNALAAYELQEYPKW